MLVSLKGNNYLEANKIEAKTGKKDGTASQHQNWILGKIISSTKVRNVRF